jgi:hypothetical protein
LGGALYFYLAAASISNEKQKRAHVYGHAFLPSHVHCAKSRFLSHVDVAFELPCGAKNLARPPNTSSTPLSYRHNHLLATKQQKLQNYIPEAKSISGGARTRSLWIAEHGDDAVEVQRATIAPLRPVDGNMRLLAIFEIVANILCATIGVAVLQLSNVERVCQVRQRE